MTTHPARNPIPAPRETIFSYISRLAARWALDPVNFASDLGASLKRFVEQDPAAFVTLAQQGRISGEQVDLLRSWTGIRSGTAEMVFRGELFPSRAVGNPVVRGCPVCLREDAQRHVGRVSEVMVMRGDWLLRGVSICLRHRHPLVKLWEAGPPLERHDIGTHLLRLAPDILSGTLDRQLVEPSAFDIWLDRRLEDGGDDTWFAGKSLFASLTFCRLLGQAILKDDAADEDEAAEGLHAVGFNAAHAGEADLRATLDRLALRAAGAHDAPDRAFGALHRSLDRDYRGHPAFDPFRAVLRDSILDHWAVAPGEVVLGEKITQRRHHSLTSAAKEVGLGARLLQPFLIEAGALAQDDPRPPPRRLFDAAAHADLLAEIPTLVGSGTLREAMGATASELAALQEEGLLVPRCRNPSVRSVWRLADGTRLVEELREIAGPVADGEGWETLLLARKRTGLGLARLIAETRTGALRLGRPGDEPGFHGLVVRIEEVENLAPRLATTDEEAILATGMSVPEFGRLVGLRDSDRLSAFVAAVLEPAKEILNPRTGRPQMQLSAETIAAFHARFDTHTTLAQRTGLHYRAVMSRLAKAKVLRFAPEGADYGPVYLAEEAAPVFADVRLERWSKA